MVIVRMVTTTSNRALEPHENILKLPHNHTFDHQLQIFVQALWQIFHILLHNWKPESMPSSGIYQMYIAAILFHSSVLPAQNQPTQPHQKCLFLRDTLIYPPVLESEHGKNSLQLS